MESGQCAVYTRDKNRYSGKCTLTTGIRTVGNVHSGQKSRQCAVYTQDRNQDSGKCTLRESGQCAVYTQDRTWDSGKCAPGQESRQVGVYNQRGIRTVCSVHSYLEVYTHDRNRDSAVGSVHSGGESGQCAVENQDCNAMYTKDRKRDNVPCTRMT